ncbi:5-oxoprolinase subunit PxpB [Gracilibacillus timonensis]|uniref:5-oxoprolinase subunit PxpB n=1 Tax=Gracilibacillus timonensis TaxID=1816696 RepID=UPI0008253A45|nr:5-oxoprolinase subunit PxpB [Gracilibacillus timonensis]
MKLFDISEYAVMAVFSEQETDVNQLLNCRQQLRQHPAVTEVILGYQSITVYFRIDQSDHASLKQELTVLFSQKKEKPVQGVLHRIPVCYEQAYGIDIEHLSEYHQLTFEQIIRLHTTPTYDVCFLGFSPGFPFLSGLNPELATPRKETPRTHVPTGAVGIAGHQTGIYPASSPGGWQIIGQTPINLLTLEDTEHPTLLQPGDQLQFYAISSEDYHNIQKKERDSRDH